MEAQGVHGHEVSAPAESRRHGLPLGPRARHGCQIKASIKRTEAR